MEEVKEAPNRRAGGGEAPVDEGEQPVAGDHQPAGPAAGTVRRSDQYQTQTNNTTGMR
jgi:hypothetical protein